MRATYELLNDGKICLIKLYYYFNANTADRPYLICLYFYNKTAFVLPRTLFFLTAIAETENKLILNLDDVPDANRRLAVCFAKKFSDLDEKQTQLILKILD